MTENIETIKNAPAFQKDEDGAVTVDWVVLAAAVVLLAIPIATTVNTSVDTAATEIADQVVEATND